MPGRYPKTLIRVLGRDGLFNGIGERAQDSLAGSTLDYAQQRHRMLQYVEILMDADQLRDNHDRVGPHISYSDQLGELASAATQIDKGKEPRKEKC